jgi:nicotinamidase-related amidase
MKCEQKERPYYLPRINVEKDLKCFGMSPVKRDLEWGPDIAILIIDMSPIFVEEILFPGAEKGAGWRAVKAIKSLLDEARPLHVPVIFTTGYVLKTDAERGAWVYKFTEEQKEMFSSFDNESLHEIVSEIAPQEGEIVLRKAKPSGFFGTQLLSILIHHHIDTLIITGMATGGCVRATVIDAFSYNYKVVVPIECVADSRPASHGINLYDIDAMYGDVRPLSEVIAELKKVKGKRS